MKNDSEKFFEEYLDSNGFQGRWEYEQSIPGKTKKLDYMVPFDRQECFFEVKELRKKSNEPTKPTFIDPRKGLRAKIYEVRRQLKEYKEFSCSFVVYNVGDWQVRLRPLEVFEAMLGNLGITMDFDSNMGKAMLDTARNTFLDGGKMINYKGKQTQYTTISAIIVLEHFRDNVERVQALVKLEQEKGRRITEPEPVDTFMDLVQKHPSADVLRVNVVENPFARVPLPDGIFEGIFDERWKLIDGKVARVFAGRKIEELESLRETQNHLSPSIE